ncbi:MAG: hypothetical protein SRB2_01900 [Desulfobacteraceae bacterium Eth-SRB2]|nr:MAG: hypothetical protein SRB2_01900 [Desulfobacteraceae bacterium Eth-SRB2]
MGGRKAAPKGKIKAKENAKAKFRKGAGNCPKNKEPNGTKTATVEKMIYVEKTLSDKALLKAATIELLKTYLIRLEETVITLVKQEKSIVMVKKPAISQVLDFRLA